MRHFLNLKDIPQKDIHLILAKALAWKKSRPPFLSSLFEGKSLGMIFEKPSTRTRLSFDLAMRQMGGMTVSLDSTLSQMQRGESLIDTVRVLNGYVDCVMIRTLHSSDLHDAVSVATIPVLNGLTADYHPCQVMADVMTLLERFSSLSDLIVTWSGDGNNVMHSWMWAACHFDCVLRIACPRILGPDETVLKEIRERGAVVEIYDDAQEAVKGAHVVMTDTWVSMNNDEKDQRFDLLKPFAVDEKLMSLADKEAVFLHCLPAYRGREVSKGVIDGKQSLVWQCSSNRLHVQKAILAWCLQLGMD